eukprot:1085814-Rhodomonas_salina.1
MPRDERGNQRGQTAHSKKEKKKEGEEQEGEGGDPRRRPPSLERPSVGCRVSTVLGPLCRACILSCT